MKQRHRCPRCHYPMVSRCRWCQPDERPDNPVYLPSAEEIRAVCREIQDGWDEDEELRRRTVQNKSWEPARVNVDEDSQASS